MRAEDSSPVYTLDCEEPINPDVPEGARLKVVWGEEDGGTQKTTVEPHQQTEVNVTVSPVPFSAVARESYQEGWRTGYSQ
ncbi:hypothetical protein [Micrococcus terreus]|uniref:hypothetical protein n=1 Tax=Micrococcus terreus TaxID=574650 RepID=UPI0029558E09|nr:hypothetical protein [Micrococcus terreus]WOO98669.1 hypothetical protein R3I42_05990 [Micrococcus terreus]